MSVLFISLRPRLHGSGQILAQTKTRTAPPCVYAGPVELDEFWNGKCASLGPPHNVISVLWDP